MLAHAVDDAKKLCGCRHCGGDRTGHCYMLETLPHVLRADADSMRHRRLQIDATSRAAPEPFHVALVVAGVVLLGLALWWAP